MNLLLWDFDGTLGYREGGWSGALLEAIRLFASETVITPEQVRPFLQSGFPWQTPDQSHVEINTPETWWDRLDPVFERACRELDLVPPLACRIARQVRQTYPNPARFRLYEDSLPALAQLSSLGWIHALLTNHVPELPGLLRDMGLAECFARVFNSAETGYEKPHPMAFRMALEAFPQVQAAWMVGDSLVADVRGAQTAGLPAVLVRKPHPEAASFCQDLVQLVGFLSGASLAGKGESHPGVE